MENIEFFSTISYMREVAFKALKSKKYLLKSAYQGVLMMGNTKTNESHIGGKGFSYEEEYL